MQLISKAQQKYTKLVTVIVNMNIKVCINSPHSVFYIFLYITMIHRTRIFWLWVFFHSDTFF